MSFELLDRASERWDELVAADSGSSEQLEQLRGELRELGVFAGERPLCTVLRPHLISEELLARQSRSASLVISAAAKVRDAVLADERLHRRHLSSFMDWVGELVALDSHSVADGKLVRLDASLARTRLHFLEINADTPQGAGHHDSILDFFERLEACERFAQEFWLRPLRLTPALVSTLLDVWSAWGGTEPPAITMTTRTDDPLLVTSLEVEAAALRERGISAEICDFRELELSGGELHARGRRVQMLYRALPTAMCLELGAELEPLFAAARAGTVCMVNPFRSELLGHKAMFALLSDLDRDFGLTAAEREAVREHVPWGRQLADGRTTGPDGRDVDLVEHVLSEREHLVLKPAHEFAGHGVRLGWHEDESGWREAVEWALGQDYVVQRRVSMHRTEYPTMDGPGARRTYYEDTDPFAFGGTVGGLLTRLSASEITNVHADGSVVASFAVGPPLARAS